MTHDHSDLCKRDWSDPITYPCTCGADESNAREAKPKRRYRNHVLCIGGPERNLIPSELMRRGAGFIRMTRSQAEQLHERGLIEHCICDDPLCWDYPDADNIPDIILELT